jgi:hypothetical protein
MYLVCDEVLPSPMKYMASLKCLLAAASPNFAVITPLVFLKLFIWSSKVNL